MVSIVTFGSSFSLGSQCAMHLTKRHQWDQCSWPRQLSPLLEEMRDKLQIKAHIKISNFGKGGYNTAAWARENVEDNHAFQSADMLIYEGASDHPDEKQVSEASTVLFSTLLDLPGKPAVLALEVPRAAGLSGSGTSRWMYGCQSNKEVKLTVSKLFYCQDWWQVPSWRAKVLEPFGVPTVSYRNAFWPNLTQPEDEMVIFGFRPKEEYNRSKISREEAMHRPVHLGLGAHQRVACLLAATLSKSSDLLRAAEAAHENVPATEEPPTNLHPSDEKALHWGCHPAVTKLQPPGGTFAAVATVGSWWFGEDVEGNGKPGWNSNQTGATVTFAVTIGPRGSVVVSRQSSYSAEMATARLTLWPKPVDSWTVGSHWQEPLSIPDYDTHQLPRNTVGEHYLHIELLPSQWRRGQVRDCSSKLFCQMVGGKREAARYKLLSITTC